MNPVIEVSEIQDCANISTEEDDCENIVAIEGEDDCGSLNEGEDDCEEFGWGAMKRALPKYQGFIFHITLKISFFTDRLSYKSSVFAASIATIVIDMTHKYRAWMPAAPILIESLLLNLKQSINSMTTASNPFKCEVTISIAGNDFKTDFMDDPPIIYDCLAHVFVAEPSEHNEIIINYTTTFFLSPAIKIAKSLYTSKGFHNVQSSKYIRDYLKIMDLIETGKNYTFERVWKNVFDEVIKYDPNF